MITEEALTPADQLPIDTKLSRQMVLTPLRHINSLQ
jgi:hypothetical protein